MAVVKIVASCPVSNCRSITDRETHQAHEEDTEAERQGDECKLDAARIEGRIGIGLGLMALDGCSILLRSGRNAVKLLGMAACRWYLQRISGCC